jgi:hypothetical protein
MNKIYPVVFLVLASMRMLHAQDRTGIAIDPSAKNIAALFTMTDEGGRLKNLELMESVFKDKTLGFVSERHHNVSSPYIYKRLEELASALDSDATLLLYFNSHGGGSWDKFAMTAQGGSFKFKKALEALGRPNRIIKRLIILVDTCHAEGSIQDSVGQDGELLKKIKTAKPSDFLPELPNEYSVESMPFSSFFVERLETDEGRGRKVFKIVKQIDYGQDSGVYEQLLIISSSSVEDLSVRGVFASRLASTFKSVKGDDSITVMEFLRRFAESHGTSGQQPHYKLLPDKSMLSELLFGPWPAQLIPVFDTASGQKGKDVGLVPIPAR